MAALRGRGPGVMRRPARREEEERHPLEVRKGDLLLAEEAQYYGQKGAVAGEVLAERDEDGRRTLDMKLHGTTIDSLLQWGSQGDRVCRWNLCPPGGPMELEGEDLVHIVKSRVATQADLAGVGWSTNLQAVLPPPAVGDENADLRDRMRKLGDRPGPDREKGKSRSAQRAVEDKDKDKGDKKKKRRKEKAASSSSSQRDRRAKKKKKKKKKKREIGGQALQAQIRGRDLGGKEEIRGRVPRRGQPHDSRALQEMGKSARGGCSGIPLWTCLRESGKK